MTATPKQSAAAALTPELLADVAARSSELLTEAMKRQAGLGQYSMGDEMGIAKAFFDLTAKMMADPRMEALGPMPFNGQRMIYGGFAPMLDTETGAGL